MTERDLRQTDYAAMLVAAVPVLHALFSLLSQRVEAFVSMAEISAVVIVALLILLVRMVFDLRSVGGEAAKLPKAVTYGAAAIILYWLAITLSVPTYPKEALYRFILSVYFVALGLTSWRWFSTFGPRPRWVGWIAIGLAAYCALFVGYVLLRWGDPSMDWKRFGLGVTNIRQSAFFLAPAAALGLAGFAVDRALRWPWFALMAASLTLSTWSGTRSTLFGFAAALVIGLVAAGGARRRLLAGALAALAIAFAVTRLAPSPDPLYGMDRLQEYSGAGEKEDVSAGRAAMWSDAVDRIAEKPLTGHGEGRYIMLNQYAPFQFNHPHNFLLQWAFSWGVPMAALLALLLLWGSLKALSNSMARPEERLAPLLTFTALGAIGLVEGTFYHPWPMLLMTLGLMMALAKSIQPDSEAAQNG